MVEQPLGHVGRSQAERALHRRAGEHELVHAQPVVGGGQVLAGLLLEPRHQVVRVQHRGLGGLLQAVGAEREDVGVGAHEDAVVALEAAQPADRLRAVEVQVEQRARAVVALAADDLRARQERLDAVRHRDRPGARPAAAVRLREGLVQVVVHDVEAHVARPRAAHDGVEVRPVVVERRARPRARCGRSPRCSSSKTPSVFGLVSIRQATSSSSFARRSSTSTPPRSSVPSLTTS